MQFIPIIFITLLLNFSALSDIIKPNPDIKPEDVIRIQLQALIKNNIPFKDAGITQTWEFAHPQNREYTGPLLNFTQMMKSKTYAIMIEHLSHNIIFVSKSDNVARYFVELTGKYGNKFGFTWTLKKVLLEGNFKDCWMTSGVSNPLPLAKST